MEHREKVKNYYLWLKARGQLWPFLSKSSLLSLISSQKTREIKVCFLGDGLLVNERGILVSNKDLSFTEAERELLLKMAFAMGLGEGEVILENIEVTSPEKVNTTQAQLNLLLRRFTPFVIITLGSFAAKALLGESIDFQKVRGQWSNTSLGEDQRLYEILPTFHPRDLLCSPEYKRPTWEDLKVVMSKLAEKRAIIS